MMTEAEAKTRWCPVVRFHTRCLGSECMGWRWVMAQVPSDDMESGQYETKPTNHGYCGLAGAP